MMYKKRANLYLVIEILIMALIFLLCGFYMGKTTYGVTLMPKNDREQPQASVRGKSGNYSLIQENSVFPHSNPVYSPKLEDVDLKYDTLIDCLIYYESRGDPEAVGDEGLARGKLQYHEATFNEYCRRYNMRLNYHNSEHQIILADEMLSRDFSNIRHWSVWKKCLF